MVKKRIPAWRKNNLREVKHTLERYIAIFAIIALGVSFFAGLAITRDAMVATLDKYLTDSNMYDYRLLSTVAFDKDDDVYFSNLEGIEGAQGGISIDFLGKLIERDQTVVIMAHSLPKEINQLKLLSGALPVNDNECVVDNEYFSSDSIGHKIMVSSDNEEDTIDSFKSDEYTIVGVVQSPEYINQQRGTTKLADGSIDTFIYIPEDGFDLDYYTEMYIKLNEDGYPYTDSYKSLIASNEERIQTALDISANARFNDVLTKAREEIAEAEVEYEDGYNEYIKEKEKVLKELDDAYAKLIDGQKEIEKNEEKLIDGQKELDEGFKEYEDGLKQYEDGFVEFNTTKASTLQTLKESQKELDENKAKVNAGISEIEDSEVISQYSEVTKNLRELENAKIQIDESGVRETYADLQSKLIQLNTAQGELENNISTLEAIIREIETSGDFIHIDGMISKYDSFSLAKEALYKQKSEMLNNPLISQYFDLKQELVTLESIDTSVLSDSEKTALNLQIDKIKSQMNNIEANPQFSELIQQFQLTDNSLNYLNLKEQLATLNTTSEEVKSNIQLIQASINEIEGSEHFYLIENYDKMLIGNIATLKAAKTQIEESGVLGIYPELNAAIDELNQGQAQLDAGIATANAKFAKAEEELNIAKDELDSAHNLLLSSQEEIDYGKSALEDGKSELEDGFKEYEDGKLEAEEGFAEVEEELEDARIKISDAKKEIADLEGPTTYIFDRSHNAGYSSFDNDSAVVAGIARVLPIFFFLVAALVCSTTMSRMVDEQRTQIGTLKSLGYSNRKIANKYVFYAGSAAFFGCLIGYILGSKYFPVAIWTAYGMLYKFAPLEYLFDFRLTLISLIVSLLCSAGVTYITCKNELLQVPAELIRPKAPKAGKRIFLETIPGIWNRIGFLRKVSIRNIFRYKKRLLMTVMGVAGCTALIIAALGIRDSVGNIANYQFDDIMQYDYEIYFTDALSEEEKKDFDEKYSDILSENVFIVKETLELLKDDQAKTFNLIATNDETITNIIDLHNKDKTVLYPEDGKVALSHGLADQAGISVGDSITIKVSDTQKVDALVGSIFENYVDNYIYITQNTYEMLFDEEAKYMNSFVKVEEENLESVAEILSNDEDIAALVSTQNVRNAVEDTMTSLNYVILLVLGFAVALAFVVVYNLNNINITERTREIATLKVLGFYPKETYVYVYRENITLTIIGILLGLFLGTGLLTFIINEIKVDFVVFKQQIFPLSYLIAIFLTFLLTILVNWILKGKIDNINMAESLNSGE